MLYYDPWPSHQVWYPYYPKYNHCPCCGRPYFFPPVPNYWIAQELQDKDRLRQEMMEAAAAQLRENNDKGKYVQT